MNGRLLKAMQEMASLLAALGAIGLVGGGGVALWVPELRPFAAGSAIIGFVLTVAAACMSLPRLRAAFSPNRRRGLLTAIATVSAVGAAAAIVNVAALNDGSRWDMTASKEFTLAPQTTEVLKALTTRIHVTGFYALSQQRSAAARVAARTLLTEFSARSGGTLTFELVDAERRPSSARAFGVSQFPTLVFEVEGNPSAFSVPAADTTEQLLLTSVLISTGQQQKSIRYLTGHGERNVSDRNPDGDGFGFAARGIVLDGYQVDSLNIAEAGGIPADTAVLVIAAPRQELLGPETSIIGDWLAGGGKAVFLVEPDLPDSFRAFLGGWGIQVGPGVIVDVGRSVTGDPQTPLLRRDDYGAFDEGDPIGRIFASLDVTFFPDATAVGLTPEAAEAVASGNTPITFATMATTSANSGLIAGDIGGEDVPGPHTMMVIAQRSAPGEGTETSRTAIAVIGDSDFVTNRFYSAYTNADLFLNTVNWLAEDFELVSVRSNPVTFRQLIMTRTEFDFVRFASWFLLPAAALAGGVVAWWRRR